MTFARNMCKNKTIAIKAYENECVNNWMVNSESGNSKANLTSFGTGDFKIFYTFIST